MSGSGYEQYWDCGLPWEQLRGKTFLVTGAGGLIASNLVGCLWQANRDLNLNLKVLAMVRNAERAQANLGPYLKDGTVQLLIQDVVDPLSIHEHVDYVVHAASSAHPGAFNSVPADVMRANFIGTMNVLDYVREQGDGRVMFVSSSEVYGENEDGKDIFREDDPGSVNFSRFRACYPESKRASETLCHCYAMQYKTDVVIVRPAFIFGKEIIDSNVRADAYFMRQALSGQDIVMKSPATQVRSYLYVKDCVMGMLYALLLGEHDGIYNIGDMMNRVTLREYATELAAAAGVGIVNEFESSSGLVFLKTTRCVLDDSRLRSLGWKPRYTMRDGIREIISASVA